MPTLRTVLREPGEVARRSLPRDDAIVAEEATAPLVFAGVGGPFRVWERRLEVAADGTAVETVRYAIDAPHWGRLVDLLLRRPARHGTGSTAPWWCPAERLTRRDATVLGLSATLMLVAGFIGALIGQTITAITRDLGGGTGAQADSLTVIRFGAVLTLAAMALADRRGRRPMIRATIVLATVGCLVTAAAPGLGTVTAAQVATRGLIAGAAFLVPIVCAEELPAGSRAYGIGLLALPGGLGAGMVLWCLPLLDVDRAAWRALFVLPLVAMWVALRTLRRLPESRRFEHDEQIPDEVHHQHVRPSRLVILALSGFLLNVFVAPTQQLQTDYLKNARGMTFTAIAAFLLITNTWGFIGILGGAQLADRWSRRLAAAVGVIGLTIGNTLMFQVGGAPMWLASAFGSVVGGAVIPSLGALLPELFPTLRRGAANGLLNVAGVAGSVVGLQIVGRAVTGYDYGPTIAVLALCPLAAAALVPFLPETAGRELEDINPDD